MKEHVQKRIELIANLAIIVTAVLLCAVIIRHLVSQPEPVGIQPQNQISSRPDRPAGKSVPPGTPLSIDGVDWARNRQTLVLALSDKCHFCTESASFYQRLARERGRTRLVAVLPQTIVEGKIYLDKLNVKVDDIKQSSFPGLGVRGTPTLILVDDGGKTINSWVGKLAPNRETEVLASLQ